MRNAQQKSVRNMKRAWKRDSGKKAPSLREWLRGSGPDDPPAVVLRWYANKGVRL
jgi:hypothetical protein